MGAESGPSPDAGCGASSPIESKFLSFIGESVQESCDSGADGLPIRFTASCHIPRASMFGFSREVEALMGLFLWGEPSWKHVGSWDGFWLPLRAVVAKITGDHYTGPTVKHSF